MSAPQGPGGHPAINSPVVDWSLGGLNAGMMLMSRRSQAISDYWKSVGAAREPGDVLAAQLGYWSQLVEDYAAAMSETVAPVAEPAKPAKPTTPEQPTPMARRQA